jgi:hypothetical protein
MIWSFYDAKTGEFTGCEYTGPLSCLAGATPVGQAAMAGSYDLQRQYVNVQSGVVESRPPGKPADTESTVYTWDAATDGWKAAPTDAGLDRDARAKRKTLLLDSDWTDTLTARTRLGEERYQAWQTFRQALCDITKQPGYPRAIVWPTPPAA